MRVPEEFGETHADGFESAAGGDDDTDGHGGGGRWGELEISWPAGPEASLRASPNQKAG